MNAQLSERYALVGGTRRYVVRSATAASVPAASNNGVWEAALASGASLSNDTILCVESITGGAIEVRPVAYRSYFEARSRGGQRMRPLAVSGFIADAGRILVGRRPSDVTQYPGLLEAIPSGSIDRIEGDGSVDPNAALLRELAEEAGIEEQFAALGQALLIHDLFEDMFDLCYRIYLSISMQDAMVRARRVGHYREISCVGAMDLLAQSDELVPTTLAIVDHLLVRGAFAKKNGAQ